MWDVMVVGAGPAGATAALAALDACPGAGVLLLDRADFPRDQACGDGIAPHALDVLAGLGVRPVDGHRPVQWLRLGFPDGPGVSGRMRRPAYVVPRAVLEPGWWRPRSIAGQRCVAMPCAPSSSALIVSSSTASQPGS